MYISQAELPPFVISCPCPDSLLACPPWLVLSETTGWVIEAGAERRVVMLLFSDRGDEGRNRGELKLRLEAEHGTGTTKTVVG